MSACPYSTEALSKGETFVGGAPLELMRSIRSDQPVTWHEDPRSGVGFWAVMRQREIDFISKRPELFSSAAKTIAFQEFPEDLIELQRPIMINMDPPVHMKYRRIVKNAFTPRRIDALEARFAQIFDEVLKPILAKRECEFVTEVACELPLIAICEIMGVPVEDRQKFFAWTNLMLEDDDDKVGEEHDAARHNAMMELFAYADVLVENARQNPQDDIIGALLRAELEGEALTADEFRYFLMILILAGNETTRTATSHGLRLFMENPEQFQLLVEKPELVEDAVEEILRFNTPIVCMRRTAMEDIEVGGVGMKAGDKVVMFYQSANHDEYVFTHPDKFDITRPQREEVRNAHRAFGVGEHFCLGSHLARLELKVVFSGIIAHLRNPRLAGEISWLKSNFINGIREMRIQYDVV